MPIDLKLIKEAPALCAKHSSLLHRPKVSPLVMSAEPNPVWAARQQLLAIEKLHFFALASERSHLLDLIFDAVEARLHISRAVLLTRCRHQRMAEVRQVAAAVAYEMTGLSSLKLGKVFKRNHSTILYSMQEVNRRPELRMQANEIIRNVSATIKKEKRDGNRKNVRRKH